MSEQEDEDDERVVREEDVERVRAVLAALPASARLRVGDVTWDLDFSRAHDALEPLDEVIDVDEDETDGRPLFVFGEEDYAEGGGANPLVVVDVERGEIFGFEPEREDAPLVFLATDAAAYVRAFGVLDRALRLGEIAKAAVRGALAAADPAGFPRSDWQALVDELERG